MIDKVIIWSDGGVTAFDSHGQPLEAYQGLVNDVLRGILAVYAGPLYTGCRYCGCTSDAEAFMDVHDAGGQRIGDAGH